MKRLWMIVVPWMAVAPCPGLAQLPPNAPTADTPDTPWTLTAYWENDGGVLKRNHTEDRHYTNGLALIVAGTPEYADRIAPLVPFGKGMDRTAIGFVVGQLMFTP